MSAVQIQTLLQPPNHNTSVERTTALLNSHFKTIEQLTQNNALDTLLESTSACNEDLKSRLVASGTRVDSLLAESHTTSLEHLTFAQELALLRHSLADDLYSLSDELVSNAKSEGEGPTLLEEIESLHRSLKELESVKSYVQVIERALKLSENAVQRIQKLTTSSTLTEESVADYKALQEFVASVKRACKNAEDGTGQEIKIVSFLDTVREKTWSGIKGALSSSLLAAAEKLHWPMPIDYDAALPEDRKSFETSFLNLLLLQDIGEKLHDGRPHTKTPKDGLYPLQALVQPVSLRFKYHFEGTRQTNRLDKPEWYFAHILNVSHDHRQFMDKYVQKLLKRGSINAWREFTRLLLPILHRKIRRSIPPLIPYPSLLAHTIYQSLAFDTSLREAEFGLAATSAQKPEQGLSDDEWDGTSEMILGRKEWFDAWLEGERSFAEDQYLEIISAHDAWHIVDDTVDDSFAEQDVRPTNSARRVKALIEQITDRYRPLPRAVHKTRFLTTVQLPILDLYHTRISESLDAFETLSSFLVRAVPGALAGQSGSELDTRRMTSGVEGVQRLIKALVSTKWIVAAMTTWGEDLFFLELWATIREKAWLRARAEANVSLPDPDSSVVEDTLFDELIGQYSGLVDRAENMIVRQICGEVEADLKSHFFRSNEVPSLEEAGDIYISPTLAHPLARLSAHLSFLQKTLPQTLVTTLYRRTATPLATHILQRGVLYRGRGHMPARDGKVVLDECNLWLETCRMALGRSVRRVEGPWMRLLEAGRLLALESDAFGRVVNVVFVGGDREYEGLMEEIGVSELSREEVTDVVRLREDCSM